MAFERSMEEKKVEHFRETMDRVTAASHVKIEYFAEHKKIEGYHENNVAGDFFKCDRLMKLDNMFGTLQLGYNPNRKRTFLFANMKTSRYDTVASRYQKEMTEDMKKAMRKGEGANRAYLSKRRENAAVLIEKRENMPWSKRTVKAYLKRANADSLQKTMPFFIKEEEKQELSSIKEKQKQLQEDIREIRIQQASEAVTEDLSERVEQEEQIRTYRKEAVQNLGVENLLQAILVRKSSMEKNFLRRLNYSYDYQKKDIEAYYREKKKEPDSASANENAEDTSEDEER